MKKILHLALALLSVAPLSGCIGTVVEGAGVAGGMYLTKPDEPPPADTADQIPPHENWCYQTLGDQVECFAEPQDTPPTRLVNVDPQSRYPLTRNGYEQVLEQNRLAHQPKVEVLVPAETMMTPIPVQPAEITPVPKPPEPVAKPKPKKKLKKKHKKVKPSGSSPASPQNTASPPAAIPNPPGIPN